MFMASSGDIMQAKKVKLTSTYINWEIHSDASECIVRPSHLLLSECSVYRGDCGVLSAYLGRFCWFGRDIYSSSPWRIIFLHNFSQVDPVIDNPENLRSSFTSPQVSCQPTLRKFMEGSYFLWFLYSSNVEQPLILMSLNTRYEWVWNLSWLHFNYFNKFPS